VIWVNHDDSPHTVTETKDAFGSAALDTDDSFAFTFTAPGDYAYFCMLHPQMAGKVVVRPAAG
jgi:plastocyanin